MNPVKYKGIEVSEGVRACDCVCNCCGAIKAVDGELYKGRKITKRLWLLKFGGGRDGRGGRTSVSLCGDCMTKLSQMTGSAVKILEEESE